MPVMRSVFYIPGNREDFMSNIPKIPADIITLDLEDSVPLAEKQNAREISHRNLKLAGATGADVYTRINSWETGMTNDDCEAMVDDGLSGVCLAKCEGPDDVKRLDWKLAEVEQKRGLEVRKIEIQLLIETAKGMMNIYQAALASPRVKSLIFGVADYTADMRVEMNQPIGEEQKWAKARMACAARAAGVIAIDCVYMAFRDIEGFEKDTAYGRQLGFEGRLLIHPGQIEPAHRLYSPAPESIEQAKEIKKVFEEEAIAKGLAVVSYQGKMLDAAGYVGALRILETQAEIEAKEKKHTGGGVH